MYWLARKKLVPLARLGPSLAYACEDLDRLREECGCAGPDEPPPAIDPGDQILVAGDGFAGYEPASTKRQGRGRKGTKR
jgi:hypothetical protein